MVIQADQDLRSGVSGRSGLPPLMSAVGSAYRTNGGSCSSEGNDVA
jgi:hypothetical protein